MDLSLLQTRVIGCLLEKEITTPEQYPLSLKSLTVACNQKSNREPVLNLVENEVQEVIDELAEKRLVRDESGFGSRVVKYKHRFCNTEFSNLQLSAQELAVVTTLFLRGAQTPGELRSRTNRLCEFNEVGEVEEVLSRLSDFDGLSLVVRLEREPGKRESRYTHLFSRDHKAQNIDAILSVVETDNRSPVIDNEKIDSKNADVLEQRVAVLEGQVDELKEMLNELLS